MGRAAAYSSDENRAEAAGPMTLEEGLAAILPTVAAEEVPERLLKLAARLETELSLRRQQKRPN
jgi:hypothetical protein